MKDYWFRRLPALLGVCALILFGAAGCRGKNFLSTKDEVRLGREASGSVERHYRVETESEDAKRVRRIGERLLVHTDQRTGVPYTFKVLDAKDVNAVSLPGGPVYVFRGLLDLVGDDDDALACVIGHEIGHVNGRHVAKQISQQMEMNLLLVLLLQRQSYTTQQAADFASGLVGLKFSRDDEFEADRRGMSYAFKAGFDPHGITRFFERLKVLEKSAGHEPEFMLTHPVTKGRIQQAEKLIEAQDYRYGQ